MPLRTSATALRCRCRWRYSSPHRADCPRGILAVVGLMGAIWMWRRQVFMERAFLEGMTMQRMRCGCGVDR